MVKELKKVTDISYVKFIPDDGRTFSFPLYFAKSNGEFKHDCFMPVKDSILNFRCNSVNGSYFGKFKTSKNDLELKLFNLLENNYSYPEILRYRHHLKDDIHNMGSIIHKQFILWQYYLNSDDNVDSTCIKEIYITEIEYLMGLVRSFFDLLQKIYRSLFKTVNPTENKLPKRFAQMVNKDENELKDTYNLTEPYLDFIKKVKSVFLSCRDMRNNIYHNQKINMHITQIELTEFGPGIDLNQLDDYDHPFRDFKTFLCDNKFKMNLIDKTGSLFYFFIKIIGYVLKSTDDFADMLEKTIKKPESLFKGYNCYLRSPNIGFLTKIPYYLDKCWIDP